MSLGYRCVAVRLLAVALLAACVTGGDAGNTWQEVDGTALLRLTTREIITLADDQSMSIARVLDRRGENWIVRSGGTIRTWRIQHSGGSLHVVRDGEEKQYRPSAEAALGLTVSPVEFPPTLPLDEKRVQEIATTVDAMFAEDQAVRKDAARRGEVRRVTADNKRTLTDITGAIGWIDVARFGARTAYRALILAKHTGDLRLLLGILPYAQRDFAQPGPDAQAFAIVYDELQLKVGGMQRYGSQVCREPDGAPVVCSLEMPSAVDRRRADLGLPPLQEYLQLVGKHLYGGREVRVPSDTDVQ